LRWWVWGGRDDRKFRFGSGKRFLALAVPD
jgi:hypothetical protein